MMLLLRYFLIETDKQFIFHAIDANSYSVGINAVIKFVLVYALFSHWLDSRFSEQQSIKLYFS